MFQSMAANHPVWSRLQLRLQFFFFSCHFHIQIDGGRALAVPTYLCTVHTWGSILGGFFCYFCRHFLSTDTVGHVLRDQYSTVLHLRIIPNKVELETFFSQFLGNWGYLTWVTTNRRSAFRGRALAPPK